MQYISHLKAYLTNPGDIIRRNCGLSLIVIGSEAVHGLAKCCNCFMDATCPTVVVVGSRIPTAHHGNKQSWSATARMTRLLGKLVT